jgi:hypothetical protein
MKKRNSPSNLVARDVYNQRLSVYHLALDLDKELIRKTSKSHFKRKAKKLQISGVEEV